MWIFFFDNIPKIQQVVVSLKLVVVFNLKPYQWIFYILWSIYVNVWIHALKYELIYLSPWMDLLSTIIL